MCGLAIVWNLGWRDKPALPSLVEICKVLAGNLGMEGVGMDPVKDAGTTLCKAVKRYEGGVVVEFLDAVWELTFWQVFWVNMHAKEKPGVARC